MTILKRKTSVLERIMFWQGTRQPVNFAFRFLLDSPVRESEIRKALKSLQGDYRHLAAKVVFTEDHQQWLTTEGASEIPVEQIRSEASWTELESALIAQKYPYLDQPPVLVYYRILATEETEFIAIFHHASVDGIAAVQAIGRFLEYLGGIAEEMEPQDLSIPINELIPDETVSDFKQRKPPEWVNEELKPHYPRIIKPFKETSFKIHSLLFSPDETDKIVKESKSNGTTVHALLGAGFLKAFAEEFGGINGTVRTIQSPMNFRPFLQEEAEKNLGNYIGIIKAKTDCGPTVSLWDIAKEIRQEFVKDIDSKRELYDYWCFMGQWINDVDNPEGFFDQMDPWAIDYDFSLSNIGKLNIPETYGPIRLKEIFGPTFSAIDGEQVFGVNTFNGRIQITFVYEQGSFDDSAAEKILKTGQRAILDAVGIDLVK